MRMYILANLLIAAALAQTTPPPAAKKTTPAAKPAGAKAAAAKPVAAKAAPAANANDPVVLTVGDQKMTKSQFETLVAALPEQMRVGATGPNKRKFAEQLTDMKAMAYEAKRRKIDQKPETKQLIALQADNLLASELFKSLSGNLTVDNATMQSYYDQHKGEFEQVKASHILIRFKDSQAPARPGQKDLTDAEALAKAKELREKIVKGGDFAAIAKAESDDTGSGANGGTLGAFGHGQMVPEFDKAAFSLKPGEISEPIRSQFGYHIIKVEEHTSKTLDEVKPQIEAKLKPELAKKAVDEVKKTVPVTISDEYFGK